MPSRICLGEQVGLKIDMRDSCVRFLAVGKRNACLGAEIIAIHVQLRQGFIVPQSSTEVGPGEVIEAHP